MTLVKLPQREPGPTVKGTWYLNQDAEVKVLCPVCGGCGDLNEHQINEHGLVSPSVVCECGFHDVILLEGWRS